MKPWSMGLNFGQMIFTSRTHRLLLGLGDSGSSFVFFGAEWQKEVVEFFRLFTHFQLKGQRVPEFVQIHLTLCHIVQLCLNAVPLEALSTVPLCRFRSFVADLSREPKGAHCWNLVQALGVPGFAD